MLGGGYYWAINRSYDASYRGQWFTQRGFAHHVDLRGRPSQTSDFNFLLYGVNDKGAKNDDGTRRPPEGGVLMTLTEFLLARVAEDEAALARLRAECTAKRWIAERAAHLEAKISDDDHHYGSCESYEEVLGIPRRHLRRPPRLRRVLAPLTTTRAPRRSEDQRGAFLCGRVRRSGSRAGTHTSGRRAQSTRALSVPARTLRRRAGGRMRTRPTRQRRCI